tara:strand:+ start:365 stop:1474 length:1110 start_codon:yes stop_codon:yes gene_type:complete
MKQKINIFIYFTCFLAFVFANKISSSANKIQVDYSDVKYDIRGRDFNADLALRKLLFSATRSNFNFNTRNESASLVTGPSKLNIQGLDLSIATDGRRGIERLDFSIGNLSFDINKCNIQLIDDFEEPRINFFDSRLSMSNISLDLSYFSLDRDIEEFLRDSNVILNKITVNQATGSMKYDESDKLRINLNGFTSLGNFKVDLIGNINERDIEDSQFEKFNIQISNISSDLKKMIKKYEIESGEKLEIKNGVLNIDMKKRLDSMELATDYEEYIWVEIIDNGQVYLTINDSDCLDWSDSYTKSLGGEKAWGDFYPQNGYRGEVIKTFIHCNSRDEVYLVRFRNNGSFENNLHPYFYVPIRYNGVRFLYEE